MKLLMGGSGPVDTLCDPKCTAPEDTRCANAGRILGVAALQQRVRTGGDPTPVAGTFSQLNGFAFTNQEVEDDRGEPAID